MQIHISSLWQELPGGALMLNDDKEAQGILLQKGVMGPLHAKNGKQNFASVTWQSADAFFIATHQIGHLMPEDNGYCIVLFPKSHFTREECIECMNAVLYDNLRNVTMQLTDASMPGVN